MMPWEDLDVMPIPKPVAALLETPMYSVIEYTAEEVWQVLDVLFYAGTYDSFCTKCVRESTFQMLVRDRPPQFVRNLNKELVERQVGITPTPPHWKPACMSFGRVAHA